MANRLQSQIMAAKNVRLLLQEANIAFTKGDERRALGHALTALGDLLRAFNNYVSIRDEGKAGGIAAKIKKSKLRPRVGERELKKLNALREKEAIEKKNAQAIGSLAAVTAAFKKNFGGGVQP